MANNPLYNSSLANLYRSIGNQMGVSPAFVNASIAQGISESSLDPNARGDGGKALGLHQWHPDRQQGLLALAQEKGLPPTDPRVQIPFWFNENKASWGITDPKAANDAAIGSERPAGWKPGNPMGVPSYDKRLGDTYALMRMQAGQSNPQDPNSFMALAPESAGEQPQTPPQAQSISLGDQENTQPLNNIGSTLANMGASIASLDRRGTGIASLNASRVASNLAAQEQAREAQGGWKYAGQTQNGQGLMFQNSRGEIRVEPLAAGFSGEKDPETIRTLKMLKANPDLMETLKEKNGSTSETPPLTEDDYSRLLDKEIAGGKLGTTEFGTGKDSNANRIGYQRFKTDNLKKFGINEDDLAKAATNSQFRGKVARDLGGTEFKFTTSYNNFMAGSQVLEEYAKQYPREWPKIIEAARQGSVLGLNMPGLGAEDLAKLDTAFDTTAIEYAKAKNPTNSNLTISEQNEAKSKFRSTMGNEELFGRLSAMRRELDANKDRMMKLHESVIGGHVASPLSSSTSAEPAPSSGESSRIRQDQNPEMKDAMPMPSRITSPEQFDQYVRENKIPPGTPFRMGDRVIYSK